MKGFKAVELRRKSPAELRGLLHTKLLEREELEAGLRQKKMKNVKARREVRRAVARLKTLLREIAP